MGAGALAACLVTSAAAASVATASPAGAATAPAATKTVLTAGPAKPVTGQLVSLRAAVKPAATGAAPTGSVTFLDNAKPVGTAVLAASAKGVQIAHVSVRLTAGTHSLTATFTGSATYAASTSAATAYSVAKAATAITASAKKGTVTGHYALVGIVKTAAPGTGIPTGTMSFTIDKAAPQTAATVSGRARLSAVLTPGTHTVVLSYSGDTGSLPSTATLTVTA
jgi:hypothetical protein